MNLDDVLKTQNARLSVSGKWLVWDDFQHWNVYEHTPYAKQSTCLISTPDLERAIEILLKDGE
jgi:hypothetical protein